VFGFGLPEAIVFVAVAMNAISGLLFGAMLRPWFWPQTIRRGEAGFTAGLVAQFVIAVTILGLALAFGR
jgi:hypothetical protein